VSVPCSTPHLPPHLTSHPPPYIAIMCVHCRLENQWYPTTMAWGPWFDRYRDMLYRYFYPVSYQNRSPYLPKSGEELKHSRLQVTVRFVEDVKLRVPYCVSMPGTNGVLSSAAQGPTSGRAAAGEEATRPSPLKAGQATAPVRCAVLQACTERTRPPPSPSPLLSNILNPMA
jgi:hypothetical protein